MKSTEDPVVISEVIATDVETAWQALTNLDLMKQWYFTEIPDFQPVVGFSTAFSIENEGRTFTHQWSITEVDPPKRIQYRWNYLEYPGDSFVTFELEPAEVGTRVTVTASVVEDFDESVPEFKRENCVAGWTYFISGNLKSFLESERQS